MHIHNYIVYTIYSKVWFLYFVSFYVCFLYSFHSAGSSAIAWAERIWNLHICKMVWSRSAVAQSGQESTLNVAGRSPWPITVEGFRSLHVTEWWTGKGQGKYGKVDGFMSSAWWNSRVAMRTWFLRLGAPAPPCNLPSRIFKRIIQLTLFFQNTRLLLRFLLRMAFSA